jgi:hypothetical protein
MDIEGLEMKVKRGHISYWKDGMIVTKECVKCNEIKNINEFNKRGTKYYQTKCKECEKKYRKENKVHYKEYKKQHYLNNKEYYKEYHKEYHQNNKEHHKEYHKEYDKQRHEKTKKDNIEKIKNILRTKELKKLPIYGYVYKIENIRTGKVYIGQTIQPLNRRYTLNIIKGWIKERLEKSNQKFTEELIEEDFEVTEVLDVACCEYHLNILEAYWIEYYDSYNNGYNNQPGNHNTNDGLEEFVEILQQHNLEFVDGQILKKAN